MQKKSNPPDLEVLGNLPVMVEYILLKDRFSNHKSPKKKIFDLKKKGYLQPVRRGQYFNLKSKNLETTPCETIANSLYFPSYISMEWALQHYGVILDRVIAVTSVTLLRSKTFRTPYSLFIYKHIPKKRYPVGYLTKVNGEERFLIARPEKALLDYVNIQAKNLMIKNDEHISEFIENDLRLDLKEFLKMIKTDDLYELLSFYNRNSKEYRILKWIIHRKELKS